MGKENQFLFQRNLSYSCVHVVGRLCSQAGFDVGSDGWALHCVWLDCAQILPATHQPPLWYNKEQGDTTFVSCTQIYLFWSILILKNIKKSESSCRETPVGNSLVMIQPHTNCFHVLQYLAQVGPKSLNKTHSMTDLLLLP